MRTVYKYVIPEDEPETVLELPSSHKVVHVGREYRKVAVWIEVESDVYDGSNEHWAFRIFLTGERIPTPHSRHGPNYPVEAWNYVGTAFINRSVWHVYRRRCS